MSTDWTLCIPCNPDVAELRCQRLIEVGKLCWECKEDECEERHCKQHVRKLICEVDECEGQYFQFNIEADTKQEALEIAKEMVERFSADLEACRICNYSQSPIFTAGPCMAFDRVRQRNCFGFTLPYFEAEVDLELEVAEAAE